MREFRIIDRGRGPEIEGTRITIYDVYAHYEHGWNSLQIACEFGLGTPQIDVAIAYIESHRPEVEAGYAKILERNRRGNPPEIKAKLLKSRAKLEEWLQRYRQEHPA